jgi:hypothetical protein
MQACGSCSVQDVSMVAQVLLNPATWLLVGATLVTLLPGKKKSSK